MYTHKISQPSSTFPVKTNKRFFVLLNINKPIWLLLKKRGNGGIKLGRHGVITSGSKCDLKFYSYSKHYCVVNPKSC